VSLAAYPARSCGDKIPGIGKSARAVKARERLRRLSLRYN
jgi:hypothetical protein